MEIENITLKKEDFCLSKQMQRILDYARANFIPVALDDTIIFLKQILKQYQPKNILEIGTAIGYSGIIMLDSVDCHLTTIECNSERYSLAGKNFADFGFSNKVTQILGNAEIELEKLCAENKKFDFIFLDGPKGQYLSYLPKLKNLLCDDGVLFSDDVLFMGLVQGDEFVKHKHRTMILRLRKFLEAINSDGLTSKIYNVGEGVAITRKIKGEKYE